MNSIFYRISFPLLLITTYSTAVVAQSALSFTEPFLRVDVSVDEPGVIAKINVKPGELVRKGDALFSLDTSVLEANLAMARQKASAEGAIQAAQAEVSHRQQRMAPIRQLWQRGQASQRELDDARLELEIAKARLKLAEEEIKLSSLECRRIEAQIARREVKSPFQAVVSDVHREVGESFIVTDPRILTIVQLDKLKVRFGLLPTEATDYRVGQKVKLIWPDSKVSGKRTSGTIDRIAPIIDAKSGTVEVVVVIDNQQQALRSGVRCELAGVEESSNNQVATTHNQVRFHD